MIRISTGGMAAKSAYDACKYLIKNGFHDIELSGGIYVEDHLQLLMSLNSKANLSCHNYFPPPRTPFVLNLASLDQEVLDKSLNHVKQAIDYSCALNSDTYSVHAGFLVDPSYRELGRSISTQPLYPQEQALDTFLNSLRHISDYANSKNVRILVENNVLSKNNFLKFQANPFLMAKLDECIHVMTHTPDNISMLVDVAHLKVSASTLNFCPIDFLERLSGHIHGYHLSDNDGLSDSNEPFETCSWFWPHLIKSLNYYTIEVYDYDSVVLESQLSVARSFLLQ